MKNILKLLPILFLCVYCKKESFNDEPNKYTLHVSVIPHGSGIVAPLGGYFEEGISVEISITTKDGYVFKEYEGDVIGTSIPITVTMNSDKKITVVFEEIDTDGDGVMDVDDQCPNTPIGEEVNEIGCSVNQKNYVPDDNFEKKLIELGYDDILDGYVPEDKICEIEILNVSYSNISDLTGIQNFTNLKTLQCSNNSLTSLDISNNNSLTNLDCSRNQLKSLDLSNNNSLTKLKCSNNPITDLDLSNNTNIDTLICRYNRLTSLDVSKNTSFVYLECSDNGIKSLDVSNKIYLTELWCSRNGMTNLNLTNATSLSVLYCTFNSLSCIKVNQSQLDNIPAEWKKDSSAFWSVDCN